jgi:NAD(P)-dependent dehydrogenase (short-subunit alcohol dehydrogenase family)
MIARTLARFGRLDCAFSNAVIEQAPTPLPDRTEATYNHVMDINVARVPGVDAGVAWPQASVGG